MEHPILLYGSNLVLHGWNGLALGHIYCTLASAKLSRFFNGTHMHYYAVNTVYMQGQPLNCEQNCHSI